MASVARSPMAIPLGPNEQWSIDACGAPWPTAACSAASPQQTTSPASTPNCSGSLACGERVARMLDSARGGTRTPEDGGLRQRSGVPRANARLLGLITTCHSVLHPVGQARTERFIESFKGKLRDECLNETYSSACATPRHDRGVAEGVQRNTTSQQSWGSNSR